MARQKRNNKVGVKEPPEKKVKIEKVPPPRKKKTIMEFQTIKMSLNCDLKRENDGGKDKLKGIITARVIGMTMCEKLA